MKKLVACLALVALVSACGDAAAPEPEPGPDDGPAIAGADVQGVWILREGRSPSGVIEPVRGADITLQIEDERAGGSGGCNTYGGGVSIDGNTFEAGGFAVTEIGCPEDVAEPEARYLEAMEDVDTVSVEGETMTLTGPDSELVFRRVPPLDPEPLTGTVWILESLVEGPAAGSAVSSAKPARLLLKDDKTFEGTTGCRAFTGLWTVSGDLVDVTQLVFEGSCDRGQDQDAHVAAVLGTAFRAEVDGRRLTLTADRGDFALVYRAR